MPLTDTIFDAENDLICCNWDKIDNFSCSLGGGRVAKVGWPLGDATVGVKWTGCTATGSFVVEATAPLVAETQANNDDAYARLV